MKEKIIAYIKAGYPCLYITSSEEERVRDILTSVVTEMNLNFMAWDCNKGLLNAKDGDVIACPDPIKALDKFMQMPEDTILLLQDFHLYMEKPLPKLIRSMKDAMSHAKANGKTIIILACRQCLLPELAKLITIIDFKPPAHEEMEIIVNRLFEGIPKDSRPEFNMSDVSLALQGMTTMEAENALSLSYVTGGQFDPSIISREKVRAIEKSGLLTYEDEPRTMSDVGGLQAVKDYTQSLLGCYSPEAQAFGLPYPKGVLLTGIAGCGKSLITKIMAGIMGLPLLALDVGRLFGGKVGDTERNTREFIDLAETIAPVYIRIDELEKAFSGMGSGGKSDGGTADRAAGTLLKWMEERKSAVYLAGTTNNINQLPPAFLRRGRWDELFFVDLPDMTERLDIWHIHVAKLNRDPLEYNLGNLVEISNGYTGAEIEQAAKNALRLAFCSDGKKLTNELLEVAARAVIPLSSTMEVEIDNMRTWAKGRALNASRRAPETAVTGRKLKPF